MHSKESPTLLFYVYCFYERCYNIGRGEERRRKMDFISKFFKEGFEHGDYSYGLTHLLSIFFVIVSIVLFCYCFRNKSEKYILGKMKIIAFVCLPIYFLRRIIGYDGSTSLIEHFWPFYLCNINTIFLSLSIIFNVRRGRDFFVVTGLIGGIFTFLIPDGIFTDRYLTFSILDSIMSHYVIVVIPAVLLLTRTHVLHYRNIHQVFIGLLIVVFNAEVLQKVLFNKNFDYLFFDSDIPFTITGVPQFIIISSLAIVLILLIYHLDQVFVKRRLAYKG